MKNKKGNVAVIAIIIVIVAITTSVITWLIATKSQAPVQQVIVTQPAPTNKPVDETADWKEYSSVNFGINFKYPANYVFMDDEKSILLGDKDFPNPDIAPGYHAPITISNYDENLLNDQVSALSNVKKSTMTVGGEKANIIEGNYQNYPAPIFPSDKHMRIITVPSKNIAILSQDFYAGIESDWNEINSAVSKLLTTIKFTK